MKISYGITVCNEETEIQRLVTFLLKHKELQDEIVITYDSKNGSKGVEEYLKNNIGFSWHSFEFKGNFSDLKNHTKSMCNGDYIFHLDADEIPHEILMEQIHTILEMNEVDLVWIPRVNTVEGLTDEWIQEWGWRVSDKGWVNYPDYQARVFRNDEEIRWVRPVHEHIWGCKTYAHLPPHEELSLYHLKVLDKQIKQNKLYTEIITGPDKYEPISLDYFLNMELATGGGGKELINQDGKLEAVKAVVDFFKNDTNMISVKDKLISNNWQYFNCMMAEFRKGVDDHHSLGWDKMTEDYYNSLELMSDTELEVFLKENPVEFDNGFIKHSYHRAVAMIGRLIRSKSYIPFYMKKQKIYNEPWENDNKIRIKTPLSNFTFPDKLNSLPKSEYCLTQSSILTLMGIRSNDDFDLIISSKLRTEMNIGTEAAKVKGNIIEIFPENYSKFMINGVQDDDDLIKNYTFQFEEYNFLEPRFYFSRKRKQGERNKTDWIAIKNFYELESFKGYPYSKCAVDKWGFEYL